MSTGNCTSSALLCMQFLTELASLILDHSTLNTKPIMNNSVAEALLATFHSYGSNENFNYNPIANSFASNEKFGNQKLGSAPKYNNYPPVIVGANIHGIETPTLTIGSFEPRMTQSIRLYSMKYCPYAERVIIYIARKNIPVDVVNINPEKPPNWFLAKNPSGRLPAIEMNGKIVFESTIVVEYLDDMFPQTSILPRDFYKRAEQKVVLQRLEGFITVLNQLVANSNINSIRNTDSALHIALKNAEHLLVDSFYGGKQIGYTDIMLWPFIERMELITLNPYTQFKYFPGVHYPKMGAYIARMLRQPEIKFAVRPILNHKGFMDSVAKGVPNYDFPSIG